MMQMVINEIMPDEKLHLQVITSNERTSYLSIISRNTVFNTC